MNYKQYLQEVTLEGNVELDSLFNKALNQVFSISYLNKIEANIKRDIKLQEKEEKDGVVAFNVGDTIYVNPNEFHKLERTAQIRYILHEFIHVLQRRRGFLFSQFKEIRQLSKRIYKLIKKHSDYPPSYFLTGRVQSLGAGKKFEALSYFMNNSINWKAVDEEGRRKIIAELVSSGLFNMEHEFWRRRLSN